MKQIIIIAFIITNSLTFSYGQTHSESIVKYRFFSDSITGFIGFKNENQEVVIEPIYTGASSFRDNGYAAIRLNAKWGVIDTSGRYVIPCMWDYIDYPLVNGLARVTICLPREFNGMEPISLYYSQGKSGYINAKNEIVIPIEYSHIGSFLMDSITNFTKGKLKIRKNNPFLSRNPYKGTWGLINKKGEIVLPDDYYTYIGFNAGPYYVAFKGKRTTVIDKTGKRYTPLKYTAPKNYTKEINKLYEQWVKSQQKHDDTD